MRLGLHGLKSILRKQWDNYNIHRYASQNHITLGAAVGIDKNSTLMPYCNLAHHCELQNSSIGLRTSVRRYTKIRDAVIGSYCSISWNVTIGAVSHPMDHLSVHAFGNLPQFGIVTTPLAIHGRRHQLVSEMMFGLVPELFYYPASP